MGEAAHRQVLFGDGLESIAGCGILDIISGTLAPLSFALQLGDEHARGPRRVSPARGQMFRRDELDNIKRLVLRMVRDHRLEGRILDFGAGTGELIKLMSRLDGIRSSFTARTSCLGPNQFPIVSNGTARSERGLDRFSGYFDAVICSEVIEHLENPRSTFRNINTDH